jgi:hypothetical protein
MGKEKNSGKLRFLPKFPCDFFRTLTTFFFRPEISDINFSTVNIKNGIPVSCTVAILSTKFVVAAWMTRNDDAESLAIFRASLCNSLKTNREADFWKQRIHFCFL